MYYYKLSFLCIFFRLKPGSLLTSHHIIDVSWFNAFAIRSNLHSDTKINPFISINCNRFETFVRIEARPNQSLMFLCIKKMYTFKIILQIYIQIKVAPPLFKFKIYKRILNRFWSSEPNGQQQDFNWLLF